MITAYIKATNYCNVGCEHCYLSEGVRADRSRMSHDVLHDTAILLRDMATGSVSGKVFVLWHGGEPLTVGASWYDDAGVLLDEMLPGHREGMQTSLIPYDGSHASLVHKRFGGALGSSIDFSTRTLRGSNSEYLDLWLRKVDQARHDGIEINPGFVPSIGEIGRAPEIVDFFMQHSFASVSVERFNAYLSHSKRRPSNHEHSQFLIELFDVVLSLLRRGEQVPRFNVISASIRGLLLHQPGDRWGGRCQSDFIVVEPDGHTNNCPDKTSRDVPFSHVETGLLGFVRSSARRESIRVQQVGHRNSHCQDCDHQTWCRGGCPITPQLKEDGNSECSGYRQYLEHARAALKNHEDMAHLTAYAGIEAPVLESLHAG